MAIAGRSKPPMNSCGLSFEKGEAKSRAESQFEGGVALASFGIVPYAGPTLTMGFFIGADSSKKVL